jgi:hypothetical protein
LAYPRKSRAVCIQRTGAIAGSVLCGVAQHNSGLRVKVFEGQAKGTDGGLKGRFTILDAGDNVNAGLLDALLGQVTDAEEVLQIIRQERPGCVNVVNTNVLALEP